MGRCHTSLQGIQAVPSQVATPAGRSSTHGLAQRWRQVSNRDKLGTVASRTLRHMLSEHKTVMQIAKQKHEQRCDNVP